MGRYRSCEAVAHTFPRIFPGDQSPGLPPSRIRWLAPLSARPEKAQEAKGVRMRHVQMSRPTGRKACAWREHSERMFSKPPPPPVSFHSLCIRVCFPCGCLLVSVVGRSVLGLVFRGVCARGERRCKCQSRPPTGDVPLLLLVHQAAGPRALRHPSCLMIRRSFPQPTHTGAPRRSMPRPSRLAAAVFNLYHNLRPTHSGRKHTGTLHQPSIRHRRQCTGQLQLHLDVLSAPSSLQPLVLLTS